MNTESVQTSVVGTHNYSNNHRGTAHAYGPLRRELSHVVGQHTCWRVAADGQWGHGFSPPCWKELLLLFKILFLRNPTMLGKKIVDIYGGFF